MTFLEYKDEGALEESLSRSTELVLRSIFAAQAGKNWVEMRKVSRHSRAIPKLIKAGWLERMQDTRNRELVRLTPRAESAIGVHDTPKHVPSDSDFDDLGESSGNVTFLEYKDEGALVEADEADIQGRKRLSGPIADELLGHGLKLQKGLDNILNGPAWSSYMTPKEKRKLKSALTAAKRASKLLGDWTYEFDMATTRMKHGDAE